MAVIRTTGSGSFNRSINAGTATESGWFAPIPTALARTIGAGASMSRKFFGARLHPETTRTMGVIKLTAMFRARNTAGTPSLEIRPEPRIRSSLSQSGKTK